MNNLELKQYPVIPKYNRKIARNRLKASMGTNKIGKAWRKAQVKKYDAIYKMGYVGMRLGNTPGPQRMALKFELMG